MKTIYPGCPERQPHTSWGAVGRQSPLPRGAGIGIMNIHAGIGHRPRTPGRSGCGSSIGARRPANVLPAVPESRPISALLGHLGGAVRGVAGGLAPGRRPPCTILNHSFPSLNLPPGPHPRYGPSPLAFGFLRHPRHRVRSSTRRQRRQSWISDRGVEVRIGGSLVARVRGLSWQSTPRTRVPREPAAHPLTILARR